jgi:hypothetical protein
MQTNRNSLPSYCDPNALLPTVQETIVLFQEPPYLFQDFVGKAISFLDSDMVRETGFECDIKRALPCKWKCADEALFGVDLCLYAYTGHYPFDKGSLGGCFNASSLPAAVHHSQANLDFGGTHVGYRPQHPTDRFGNVPRPLLDDQHPSADCGYLMNILVPFKEVYDDACKNILLLAPNNQEVLVSVPNEYLQPIWSSHHIKLLVNLEHLTDGLIPYEVDKPYTHKIAGRTLFKVAPPFLDSLSEAKTAMFRSAEMGPIGDELVADCFHIFDSDAELVDGVPSHRFLPYMKFILSSKLAPYPLKAAVTHANIEHNRLVDAVRTERCRPYAFACFTGVFIDIYDDKIDSYVNLFQPIGVAIKAAGRAREVEFTAGEIRQVFKDLKPAEPVLPLKGVLGYPYPAHVLESFTYPSR